MHLLNSALFPDPFSESCNVGVDTRVVGSGAAVTPGHDTVEDVVSDHRTARITLAGVFTTLGVITSTDHPRGYFIH